MSTLIDRFVTDQSGEIPVQYRLIAAVIAIAIIAALASLPGLGTMIEPSVLS